MAAFDGRTLRPGTRPEKLFNDFFAFEDTLRDGVYVTAGDVDGDGRADLVAGGGPGGGPRVLALSGADLMAGRGGRSRPVANFFAGGPGGRGGVRVAARGVAGDGRAGLVTAALADGTNAVVVYAGASATAASPDPLYTGDGFEAVTGVYVAERPRGHGPSPPHARRKLGRERVWPAAAARRPRPAKVAAFFSIAGSLCSHRGRTRSSPARRSTCEGRSCPADCGG